MYNMCIWLFDKNRDVKIIQKTRVLIFSWTNVSKSLNLEFLNLLLRDRGWKVLAR